MKNEATKKRKQNNVYYFRIANKANVRKCEISASYKQSAKGNFVFAKKKERKCNFCKRLLSSAEKKFFPMAKAEKRRRSIWSSSRKGEGQANHKQGQPKRPLSHSMANPTRLAKKKILNFASLKKILFSRASPSIRCVFSVKRRKLRYIAKRNETRHVSENR